MGLPFEEVQKVVEVSAKAISGVYSMAHGGGLFTALGLLQDLSVLKTLNKATFVAELKDLDPTERKALLVAFKAKLSVADAALQAKIDSGADCLDEAVTVGLEAYAVVEHAMAVVNKVKGVVS